eukprot:4468412-Alexandrium_andersonii.AAC.1
MLEQVLALVGALQLRLRRAGARRRAVLVLRRAGACPALDGAFLLLRSLGAGAALHDAGHGGNEAGFTLIVGFSIIVVV